MNEELKKLNEERYNQINTELDEIKRNTSKLKVERRLLSALLGKGRWTSKPKTKKTLEKKQDETP